MGVGACAWGVREFIHVCMHACSVLALTVSPLRLLQVPVMGVGAWAWGDRSGYWGYGSTYGQDESRAAYDAIYEAFGDDAFIDTAEVGTQGGEC